MSEHTDKALAVTTALLETTYKSGIMNDIVDLAVGCFRKAQTVKERADQGLAILMMTCVPPNYLRLGVMSRLEYHKLSPMDVKLAVEAGEADAQADKDVNDILPHNIVRGQRQARRKVS